MIKNELNTKDGNIIKVEDYIVPEIMSDVWHVIHSAWSNKDKKGILFLEKINCNWFIPIEKYNILYFDNLDKLKEKHLEFYMQLDWRMKKQQNNISPEIKAKENNILTSTND